MKKKLLYIILTFIFISCNSDSLSNSKAKKIITECLEATPEQRQANITIGKATFRNNKNDLQLLQKYKKLTEDNYLEMNLIREISRGWNKGAKEYNIQLTKKALEYMIEVPENGGVAYAKTFKYKVDKVLEVHEIPSMNVAQVKVNFKAVDISPFAVFSAKDPSEFWIKELQFSKTSNGWKHCDNF